MREAQKETLARALAEAGFPETKPPYGWVRAHAYERRLSPGDVIELMKFWRKYPEEFEQAVKRGEREEG